jgi:two-component system LytT family response regulator
MINVVIIDDEIHCAEVLEKLLLNCNQNLQIIGKADDVQSGIELINKLQKNIDLLFLDIHMPGGNGFNIIKSIPDINFKIVFTTAFDQYAINAIKFSALDYLLKPIDQNELQNTLNRFETNVAKNFEPINTFKENLIQNKIFDKLAVLTQNEISFIDVNEILYLESDKNYSIIYLTNGEKIVASKNLGYYEEILAANGFFRTHQSYMVNISKIKKFIRGKKGVLELGNGSKVEVSIKRKDDLFKILNIQ